MGALSRGRNLLPGLALAAVGFAHRWTSLTHLALSVPSPEISQGFGLRVLGLGFRVYGLGFELRV